MLDRMISLIAVLVLSSAAYASEQVGPSNAAIEQVFRQTVEQAKAVEMKPGEVCPSPVVRLFKVIKRGLFTRSADKPQGYYPVTVQVELRCKPKPTDEYSQWQGELEMQVFENAQQLWTVQW